MFWKDIANIKESMTTICHRLTNIEMKLGSLEDKNSEIAFLVREVGDKYLVHLTIDKFRDYMKNVDKLNSLVNEFKGCVSLARGALEERKEIEKQTDETKKLADISKDIYHAMQNFISAGSSIEKVRYFKIDAIYKAICEQEEKKSLKKPKSVKKKAVES